MMTSIFIILRFTIKTTKESLYSIGIVHQKMTICWKSTHPQAIQDVDEFVSSSEQI